MSKSNVSRCTIPTEEDNESVYVKVKKVTKNLVVNLP